MAKPTCSYPGCQYRVAARGLCSTHYRWWRKTCDPAEIKVFFAPAIDRWFQMTRVGDISECWDWTGCLNDTGYGLLRLTSERRNVRAHRFGYEHFRGPFPPGMEARHTCDRPICVNPWHIEPGSHARNMLDSVERGRTTKGRARQMRS